MKVILISWQAIGVPVALGLIYWFLVRPWRRERRITFDGLLCLSAFMVVWQDPLSSYFNHWYTYNSYLVNFGSWVKEVPGWMSYSEPGRMDVEPIIWTPFLYVYLFFGGAVFGCWVMRKACERWPRMGSMGLILFALLAGMLVDFVAEGLLIMPAGVYTYAGGHLAIFPEAYHKFPLTETVTVGAIIAGLAALRFFKDDRGYTVVERGVEKLKVGEGGRSAVRFLAIFGITNVLVLACYNIPNSIIGAHSTAWPKDLQQRSYLTDYLCGQGHRPRLFRQDRPAQPRRRLRLHGPRRPAGPAAGLAAAEARPLHGRRRRSVQRTALLSYGPIVPAKWWRASRARPCWPSRPPS